MSKASRDPTILNVGLLATSMALGMSATSMMMIISGLVGYSLAEDKSLATLPLGLTFVAVMLTTIPASLIMRRIGRRAGFSIGAAIGVAGALVAGLAVWSSDFWLFALGSALIGVQNGVTQLYRFAAADTASESFRSKAISLVLAGGVIAAVLGPELANQTRALFADYLFLGCYIATAALYLLVMVVLQFIRIPNLTAAQRADHGRPLKEITRQPLFVVAVLSAAIGYGMMTLLMTSTPLAMDHYAHSFEDTAWVIQWHALAMFAPSFITGTLIKRLGVQTIILTGCLLNAGAITLGLIDVGVWEFWGSLALLGLGWNFMFIGGTTMATECYRPEERNKVQAINDFVVFSVVAFASLSSGVLHATLGWQAVVIGVMPFLGVVVLANLWLLARGRNRVTGGAAQGAD